MTLVAARLLGAADVQPDEGRRFWMPETDGVPVIDLAGLTLLHGGTHRGRALGTRPGSDDDDAVALVMRSLTDGSSPHT